jgi:hypothetical protein
MTPNVPVQRPDDVYWMLALYPSRESSFEKVDTC